MRLKEKEKEELLSPFFADINKPKYFIVLYYDESINVKTTFKMFLKLNY